ncbi:hypothetical protein LSAT2_005748, partial [Lamellibrachia satsuma]
QVNTDTALWSNKDMGTLLTQTWGPGQHRHSALVKYRHGDPATTFWSNTDMGTRSTQTWGPNQQIWGPSQHAHGDWIN